MDPGAIKFIGGIILLTAFPIILALGAQYIYYSVLGYFGVKIGKNAIRRYKRGY